MRNSAYLPTFNVRSLRILAAGSLLATLFVLGLSINSRISDATTPSALPKCATSSLDVWFDTVGNGAAGTSYYQMYLTNFSGHTCTLEGYPGVSGVSITQHQLGSAASRNNIYPTKVITLTSAGAGLSSATSSNTALVTIGIVDAGNYSASTCKPVTAAGLKVYPPSQTASKFVPFPFSACSKAGALYLTTSAVEKSVL
jgi:hypothetical protein